MKSEAVLAFEKTIAKTYFNNLAEENEKALLLDGFEDAYVGIARRCGQPALAVYDRTKCIQILMNRDGMILEEAEEFFEFNVAGAWCGPNTPIIVDQEEKCLNGDFGSDLD